MFIGSVNWETLWLAAYFASILKLEKWFSKSLMRSITLADTLYYVFINRYSAKVSKHTLYHVQHMYMYVPSIINGLRCMLIIVKWDHNFNMLVLIEEPIQQELLVSSIFEMLFLNDWPWWII